jgi:hypothetical protein
MTLAEIEALVVELDSLLANVPDLDRLRRLEDAGVFRSGFASDARAACLAYTVRIFELREAFRALPYPGPTITIN